MSNMSYCMFENTETDFSDCVEEIEVNTGAFARKLSRTERLALKRLITKARTLVQMDGEYGLLDELEEVKDKP